MLAEIADELGEVNVPIAESRAAASRLIHVMRIDVERKRAGELADARKPAAVKCEICGTLKTGPVCGYCRGRPLVGETWEPPDDDQE